MNAVFSQDALEHERHDFNDGLLTGRFSRLLEFAAALSHHMDVVIHLGGSHFDAPGRAAPLNLRKPLQFAGLQQRIQAWTWAGMGCLGRQTGHKWCPLIGKQALDTAHDLLRLRPCLAPPLTARTRGLSRVRVNPGRGCKTGVVLPLPWSTSAGVRHGLRGHMGRGLSRSATTGCIGCARGRRRFAHRIFQVDFGHHPIGDQKTVGLPVSLH